MATEGPAAVLAGHAGRLAALLDRETRRVERGNGRVDPKHVAELARAGLELAKLVRAIAPGEPAPAPARRDAAPAGFLDALAADPNA